MTIFTVESLGHKGDGLLRTDDGVVHLPKVLAGEQVEIRHGRLTRVVMPSPDRIDPFCPHHATCGGCRFQHWHEAPYRKWKHRLVETALAHHGLAIPVDEMLDAHGHGRRRVTFHVRWIAGVWRAGFMELNSHDLCVVDTCPVLAPNLAKAAETAAAFGPILGNCDVSLTAAVNGVDVAAKAERGALEKRLSALMNLFHLHKLLRLVVNGEVFSMREQPLITCGRVHVPLPPQSFLQATEAGEQALADIVLASLRKARNTADLFCGLGTFLFRMAERLPVAGFDSDKSAIESLNKAARNTQGLKPVTAMARNLFNAPLTMMELKAFDTVVLDPPRAGAEAQARNLAKSAVKTVIYVSCDPQSFARDASILGGGGFTLERVTPVDQFKWTAHVELVGVFRKK